MNVGCQRAANREPVRSSLLLNDAPGSRPVATGPEQVGDKFWPLNTGLDGDEAAFDVQIDHAAQASHIEQPRSTAELLPTHCVAPTGNADWLAVHYCLPNHLLKLRDGSNLDDVADARWIQLRVQVVDET
jgi:hypothetical protein